MLLFIFIIIIIIVILILFTLFWNTQEFSIETQTDTEEMTSLLCWRRRSAAVTLNLLLWWLSGAAMSLLSTDFIQVKHRMKLINHQRATLLLTSFTKWNIYLFYNGLTHVLWTSLLKTYLTNTSWPLRLGHVTIRCQKPCSVGSRPLVVHHCLDRFPISMFVFVVYYCDVNIVVCTACPPWTRLCACACELDHTYLYRHRLHKDLFRVLWFLCWF